MKVWIISECHFAGHSNLINICSSGKIAEQQLMNYLNYLAEDADLYLDNRDFINELERINEARNCILSRPLDELNVGAGIFAGQIQVKVYNVVDIYNNKIDENQSEWIEEGRFKSPSDPDIKLSF